MLPGRPACTFGAMNALRLAPALALLTVAAVAHAQGTPWYDPDPLPQGLTAEEALRRDEIGAGFRATPPPPGPVRNVAEFERSEAVLVRYPLGIPLALVAALSEHVRVITTVASAAQQTQAASAFQSAGVTMANVDFLRAPTNSIWTRDYGPFYVATGDRRIGIVDFVYNRPRPDDDAVPAALGAHLGMPVYAMGLVHTGGNYMAAGRGASASSDLVWEENGADEAPVRQTMLDFLGVRPYLVTLDPQDSYLKHIDCWAKFLDVDKVLIARVAPSDPHYAAHEAVAAFYASQTSAYGTPYQVVRVDAPDGQPYTNSLIVNDRVYVPVVGSPLDAAALDVYRAAMPGYDVRGVTGSWLSTDALHCRVKEVPDRGMLSVLLTPPPAEVPSGAEVPLSVDVVPYSGQPLRADRLFLIYRAGAAPFDTLALAAAGGDTFTASIPAQAAGAEVSYYVSASDASGRTERFPLVGPAGPRRFRVVAPTASEPAVAPSGVRIAAVSPNPARGPVTVDFSLDAPGPATLEVLDGLGRRVAVLYDGPAAAGLHRARWDAADVPAGLYLVRLAGPGGQAVRRLVLAR